MGECTPLPPAPPACGSRSRPNRPDRAGVARTAWGPYSCVGARGGFCFKLAACTLHAPRRVRRARGGLIVAWVGLGAGHDGWGGGVVRLYHDPTEGTQPEHTFGCFCFGASARQLSSAEGFDTISSLGDPRLDDAAYFQLLRLTYDKLLSSFAFNVNLRRYLVDARGTFEKKTRKKQLAQCVLCVCSVCVFISSLSRRSYQAQSH